MTQLPSHVDIREVGPRDGLQIEAPISTAGKIRLLQALVATGVRRIEATAFVSPRAVPAMADAERIAEYVGTVPGVVIGSIILQAINYGLYFLGVNAYLQYIIRGAIIIIAVAIDVQKYVAKK